MSVTQKKLHTLFLSAWYPNRYDAMSGLFVRKHADAVSLFCNVTVLYVHADEKINKTEVHVNKFKSVNEIYIYFPKGKEFLKPFMYPIQFVSAYMIGIRQVRKSYGLPDIVHVNILTRTAIPALIILLTKKIPFVVTEHWTRYLPSRNSFNGIIRKLLTKLAVKRASAIMPVSEDLMNAMIGHGLINKNYKVINNVVEDFFYSTPYKDDSYNNHKKQILHISCFDDEQKNISGILRVIKLLSEERNDFTLTIAGTGKDEKKIKTLASTLHLTGDQLIFTGELPPPEIARLVKQADFLLLFSNNENAPVVISESLASGKPVVSTNVGGIPEMINSTNGILVNPGDEEALKKALHHMLNHYKDYNANRISADAFGRYSYQHVGEMLFKIYEQTLL
jgi:glycosyltransferase involved in cell wall biosynthesis